MGVHKTYDASLNLDVVNHYVIDTDDDVALLPTNVAIGSDATSFSTGKVFVLNTYRVWQEFGTEYTPEPEPGDETLPVVGTGTADHAVLTE